MYTSDIEKSFKTGMTYLAVSLVIAAAGAVYGLFGHGVYSYYMTYAFMIPLLAGAMPHLIAALSHIKNDGHVSGKDMTAFGRYFSEDARAAVIAALTTGSLVKGALDIYGTTNALIAVYGAVGCGMLGLAALRMLFVRRARGTR